jgi:hypothetical protein
MKKIIFIILTISLILCGCGKKYSKYYNSNEMIIDQSDHYNYKNCTGEIQERNVDLTFEFSGTDTIWTIESENNQDFKCKYNANIKNGLFKMVHISPDKTIITEVEGNTDALIIFQLKKGINIIKITGVDCKGKLNISVEEENLDGIKIKPNDKKEFPWN